VRVQALRDEPVLAAELLVQRALGDPGRLAQQVDADGPDALPVEQVGGGVQRQFATNVFGLLTMTRAALPAMRARKSGRIINISSVVGRTTFPGMGVYGATKYAVEALSDALRQEVAGFGIKVVIIEPGFTATNLGEADGQNLAGREIPDDYAATVASGTRYLAAQIARGIAPEQVAATIVKVAEHPNPRLRYVVPASARPLIALLTTLPGRLADQAKQRALSAS
jgi:NAD(P)-dependent dehydrogenase (short-subunit alcohol dehydrogenase family)